MKEKGLLSKQSKTMKKITEYSTETDDALVLLQAQEQVIFNQCQQMRVLAGISFLLFTFLLLK